MPAFTFPIDDSILIHLFSVLPVEHFDVLMVGKIESYAVVADTKEQANSLLGIAKAKQAEGKCYVEQANHPFIAQEWQRTVDLLGDLIEALIDTGCTIAEKPGDPVRERLPQPMQPIITDEHGLPRFQANALIQYLFEHSGLDLNELGMVDAPKEDREQFAQLTGYSVRGFCGLDYVRPEVARAAERMARSPHTLSDDCAARIEAETALQNIRLALRRPIAELFDKHPDDLWEVDE